MRNLRQLFLDAKAWQLFVLLLGTPIIAMFMEIVGRFTYLSIALMAVSAVSAWVWFWSLGSFLASVLKPELRLGSKFFNFACIYPTLYMFVFFWFFTTRGDAPVGIILPLHLLAMVSILYLLYYVAKSLTMAELGRPAEFSDYAGSLLLLWFYPLGVWVIQPKINTLQRSAAST